MIEPCPLERLERIKAMLAADMVPLKDGAGIIIPAAVDAHHRASAYRRAVSELQREEAAPCSASKPSET